MESISRRKLMAPRNHKQWRTPPKVEYISSECYNNNDIFKMEQEEIFSKVWIPMCHISEMYEKGNYRTTQIAGQNVIAYNTGELGARAFLNHGPQMPSGKLWNDDTFGRELHCEIKHGGMVWVTLDSDPTQSVDEWTAGAFDSVGVPSTRFMR